jgi:Ca2+-binding EF-hand superfamily protein
MSKNKSPKEIFAHLDRNRDGSLTCDELKDGLKKIPFFSNIVDDDFEELFRGIDVDGSGEVDVAEFIDCVVNCKEPTGETIKDETVISSDSTPVDRFRAVVIKAVNNGASLEDMFSRLDSNGDGFVTKDELRRELKNIPLFSNFVEADFSDIFRKLDGDGSGEVKVSEFIDMISPPRKQDEKSRNSVPFDPKQSFIRQITMLEEYSGIRGVCAFLDEDEDGLVELSSLKRFLRREGFFHKDTGLTEEMVDDLLADIMRKDGNIRVQNLLQFVENDGQFIDVDEMNSESEDDDHADPEYEFSNEPQIRSLEKKLRHVGRTLCKKGVDIEGIFKNYDTRFSGVVRRTEFLEVLSKLGLYILEQNSSLAADSKDGDEEGTARLQQRQLHRLRRSGPERSSKAAVKLMGAKNDGDFKVICVVIGLVWNWANPSQMRRNMLNPWP